MKKGREEQDEKAGKYGDETCRLGCDVNKRRREKCQGWRPVPSFSSIEAAARLPALQVLIVDVAFPSIAKFHMRNGWLWYAFNASSNKKLLPS